ncbi:MAG: hypothetical protein LUJ25_02815, partial [Firmicutes bacterium]|nr:hypothetical protein [Bacillota bacterium]
PDDTSSTVTGTADDVEITTFAGASTGTVTLSGDFTLTYTFTNKSNGSENWENFVVEVFSSDGIYVTVRADNYGWLANQTDSSDTITFGDGLDEDGWAAWNAAMAAGSECTVTIEREGTNITITYESGGATFTANAYVSEFEDADLTIHLTGENVTLSNISYAYTLASASTVTTEPTSPQTGYAIASLSILAVVSGAVLAATGAMKKRNKRE